MHESTQETRATSSVPSQAAPSSSPTSTTAPRPGGASGTTSLAEQRAAAPAPHESAGRAEGADHASTALPSPSADRLDLSYEEEGEGEGNVVTRTPDGRTTTKTPDGKTVVEYEEGGNRISETSYTRDGAQVRETIVREANGDTTSVAEVERDGLVDVTRTRTTTVDQDVEAYASDLQAEELRQSRLAAVDGERRPTEQITLEHTITDTNEVPPTTRKLSESTRYRQVIALSDDDATLWSHKMEVDRETSGTTLAVSRETRYDAAGRPTAVEEASAARQWIGGPDAQGRTPSHAEAIAFRDVDGRADQVVETDEDLNLRGADLPNLQGREYYDRLQAARTAGEPIQRRTVAVTTYDEQGLPQTASVETYGEDIDDMTKDGPRVAIHQVDGKTMWAYTQVSDGGQSVDSQISVQGTDTRMITRQRPLPGGGYTRESEIRNGDSPPSFTASERMEPVTVADVGGSPLYRKAFLEASGDGPFFRYARETVDHGKNTRQSVERYASENGAALVHVVSDDPNDARTAGYVCTMRREADLLYAPRGEQTWTMRSDDAELALDRTGALTVNGEALDIAPGIAAADVEMLKTSKDAAAKFRGALKTAEPGKFGTVAKGAMTLFGVASDTFGLATDARDGDVVGAVDHAGGATSSLGTLSELGGKMAGEARAANLLSMGGKALGVAGGAIGLGLGVYEITQGQVRDGVLDSAVAAGGMAALTGVGTVPGALVAGTALTAKLAFMAIEGERIPPLEI